MYVIAIIAFISMNMYLVLCQSNMTSHIIVGTGTPTTEYVHGTFSCNGNQLKGFTRNNVFPTEVPCTGMTVVVGNDTYEMTMKDGTNETMDLIAPHTISAYVQGYQLFTQFGPITKGTCQGGYIFAVQMLRPVTDKYYQGCLATGGLKWVESFFVYARIQGGQCQGDCSGNINIVFKLPVL